LDTIHENTSFNPSLLCVHGSVFETKMKHLLPFLLALALNCGAAQYWVATNGQPVASNSVSIVSQ
jgi:hypothetical protein